MLPLALNTVLPHSMQAKYQVGIGALPIGLMFAWFLPLFTIRRNQQRRCLSQGERTWRRHWDKLSPEDQAEWMAAISEAENLDAQ